MKKSTKKVLDQLEKEEKKKTFWGIVKVALLLLGGICFMAYLYDPFQTTGKQYEGTITGAYKPESDERAAKTRLLIELYEGKTVRIIATRAGAYQVGKRVIVEQLSSKRFKRRSYRFVKYIEPPIKYLNESEQKRITRH